MPKKLVPLRRLHKIVWDLQSKWIRQKDADWQGNTSCYTCLVTHPWKEMQAGHYRHGNLDFDLRNIHPQCVRCNKWLHGNPVQYAIRLIDDYGTDILKTIQFEAATRGNKYSRAELERLKKEYQELLKKHENIVRY